MKSDDKTIYIALKENPTSRTKWANDKQLFKLRTSL